MKGLAIMASSTGAELSQESAALKGSYFTHHLVSGLRGAADKNADGSVTLSEAYTYAYNTTLLATAVSAVGKQHVTLETDLRGNGDVALTRPAKSDAKMLLPASLAGAVTISTRDSVVAEVNKVAGDNIVIALPTGRYSMIVRTNASDARECKVNLRGNTAIALDWQSCSLVPIDAGVGKGTTSVPLVLQPDYQGPRWYIELGFGLRGLSNSAYTDRLETFGYERNSDFSDLVGLYDFKAYRRMSEHLQLGVGMGVLDEATFRRHTDGASTYDLEWTTVHVSALARLYQDIADRKIQLYAETLLGLAIASSELREEEMQRVSRERDYGYAVIGSVGAIVKANESIGYWVSVGYSYAPALNNELGEVHTAAGLLTQVGVVLGF